MSWACPRCKRTFRQVNQRHACGVGSAATLLKGRPPALTDLYRKLETTVKSFGGVEVVTRNRYALFRTTRIFADLTVMRDALRVVIHLARKVRAPYFIKIGPRRVAQPCGARKNLGAPSLRVVQGWGFCFAFFLLVSRPPAPFIPQNRRSLLNSPHPRPGALPI